MEDHTEDYLYQEIVAKPAESALRRVFRILKEYRDHKVGLSITQIAMHAQMSHKRAKDIVQYLCRKGLAICVMTTPYACYQFKPRKRKKRPS